MCFTLPSYVSDLWLFLDWMQEPYDEIKNGKQQGEQQKS